jgi:sec-independent protein translocase protein TatB
MPLPHTGLCQVPLLKPVLVCPAEDPARRHTVFFDMGPLEVIALIILAVIVFGPEKLPKVVKDVSTFVRKIRDFSDSAKEDIRKELGPEFRDFEFEDLNPRNFMRKHVLEGDELGLKEIRNGFDFREDVAELTDVVNGRDSGSSAAPSGSSGRSGSSDIPDRLRKRERLEPGESPPFDSDAT